MKFLPENARLIKESYWLIKLRWIATASVGVGTYFSSSILGISLQDFALYAIAVTLALYNSIMFLLLNRLAKSGYEAHIATVKNLIKFQIYADLALLTLLLHYSGGIENPFIFYFMFHMIIASILLTVTASYLQATFAVLFFGLVLLLEYLHIVPHYCLGGFVTRCLYQNGLYVLGTYFVFTTAVYLAVYMGSYIATRLKAAERAYREANVLLSKKDRIKDEYVQRVTHDIKGDLSAIQSCLDAVSRKSAGSLNGQQEDFIKSADIRTKKVSRFVKALLKLTQMRLANNFEMAGFSLRDTLNDVVAAVKARAGDKNIVLNCSIEPSIDKIFGNQLSIEEAVTNLLLNAVKYTPPNGTIDIKAKDDDSQVIIEVSDTGIGISPEDLPRIFDEFYRAKNAKEVEKDGTGLGLTIAKQIIERHNGRIWVESQQGVGTKFSFVLSRNQINSESCSFPDDNKK